MKVENYGKALAQESCESEQNSLSYDLFKKGCSHHQNMFSQKSHNLISFAQIHMILMPT